MVSKRSPSELDHHLGYWLRYVSNHVSHEFASKVEERGVTVAEWVLLRAMFDVGECNPSQLAKIVGMSRGAISKLVERLCNKALAIRTVSDGDRRYQTVALTTAGKRLVPILARLADENDQEYFGHLTETDRQMLGDTLRAIVRKHGWKDLPIE